MRSRRTPACTAILLGVIPFRDARNSCVIAANAKAKRFGVKTGIAIAEARRLCPRIALVPQRPDLYVRTQQRIVVAVLSVLPIDVICSIDEFAAVLEDRDCPEEIAGRIKQCVREAVGSISPAPSVAHPTGGSPRSPPTSTSRMD